MCPSQPTLDTLTASRIHISNQVNRLFRYLLFFNTEKHRKIAIDKLKLESEYTILDIGCGTGLSFPLLEERVLK